MRERLKKTDTRFSFKQRTVSLILGSFHEDDVYRVSNRPVESLREMWVENEAHNLWLLLPLKAARLHGNSQTESYQWFDGLHSLSPQLPCNWKKKGYCHKVWKQPEDCYSKSRLHCSDLATFVKIYTPLQVNLIPLFLICPSAKQLGNSDSKLI